MIKVYPFSSKARVYKNVVLKAAKLLMAEFGVQKKLLEIYLVTNRELKKNVLSFTPAPSFPRPDIKLKPLGEIYLNPEFVKTRGEDLIFMLCHGFLHLIGYDHSQKNDRIKMERRENILRKKIARRLKV